MIVVLALVMAVAGCSEESDGGLEVDVGVDSGGQTSEAEAEGFLDGFVDGFISPVTGLASLFSDDVTVYESDRDGSGYAVGFSLGLLLVVALLLSAIVGGRRYYVVRRY